MTRPGALPKAIVKHRAQCNDSLLQIAGRRFLGVPSRRCEVSAGSEVELLEGPISVSDHDGRESQIVKIRHKDPLRDIHEGWIPQSALQD